MSEKVIICDRLAGLVIQTKDRGLVRFVGGDGTAGDREPRRPLPVSPKPLKAAVT